ncbi:MAG: MFS transporter [Anaerolineales bacterium]|nr:MFS transporter [Anaerolineales bacterium]MCW5854558.1 MFS transporter [Anaerolineales bacterium]
MYFFLFLALSAVVPYLTLYLSDVAQLSGSQIGVVLSVGPVIGLFATPFWTGLADASKRHAFIYACAIGSAVLLYALVPFVGSFVVLLAIFTALAFFGSHLLPMQDSATMHMLGNFKDRYGQVRFWGTVGWGLGGLLFGWLFDFTGLVWMFWICSGFLAIALSLAGRMQFDQAQSQSVSFFKNLRELISKAPIQLFLLATVLAATGLSTHNNYLSLLLNELSGPDATVFGWSLPVARLIGIVVVIGVVSELPVMFHSERLLARLGTRGLVIISLLIIAGRNLLYALSDEIWPILLVQALHGLTYALLWVGGVSFMARHAPKGLSSTAQGLFSTAQVGVGYAAGNLFGGVLMDTAGLQGMFAISGLVVLAGFGLLMLLDRRYHIF